jgi:hypothetical protein
MCIDMLTLPCARPRGLRNFKGIYYAGCKLLMLCSVIDSLASLPISDLQNDIISFCEINDSFLHL